MIQVLYTILIQYYIIILFHLTHKFDLIDPIGNLSCDWGDSTLGMELICKLATTCNMRVEQTATEGAWIEYESDK